MFNSLIDDTISKEFYVEWSHLMWEEFEILRIHEEISSKQLKIKD